MQSPPQRPQRRRPRQRAPGRAAEPADTEAAIRRLTSFYLSDASFPHDRLLQGLAARHGGWVPVRALAEFPAVQKLRPSAAQVEAALRSNPELELKRPDDDAAAAPESLLVRSVERHELRRVVLRGADAAIREGESPHSLSSVCLPASAAAEPWTVMSYNVLAQQLATPEMFPYASPEALEWRSRAQAIRREVLYHRPSILLLQELQVAADDDAADDASWFAGWLARTGYRGVTKGKEGADGSVRASDIGCGLFWRRDAFRVVRTEEVALAPALLAASTDRAFRRLLTGKKGGYSQVALLVELRDVASGASVAVATTHLSADYKRPWLQLMQMQLILDRLAAFAGGLPVVFGGDLNSTPGSAVLQLLAEGRVPADHPDLRAAAAAGVRRLPFPEPRHALDLSNAVQRVLRDSPVTNFTHQFQGALDHVFASRLHVSAVGALSGYSQATLAKRVALPSERHPSDHLSVGVVLRPHAPCRFREHCRRGDCTFTHPQGRYLALPAPPPGPAQLAAAAVRPCRDGAACRRADCRFGH